MKQGDSVNAAAAAAAKDATKDMPSKNGETTQADEPTKEELEAEFREDDKGMRIYMFVFGLYSIIILSLLLYVLVYVRREYMGVHNLVIIYYKFTIYVHVLYIVYKCLDGEHRQRHYININWDGSPGSVFCAVCSLCGVYEYDVYIMLKFILMFDKNNVIKSFSTDFSDYFFRKFTKTFFIEIALRIVENINNLLKKMFNFKFSI